VLTHFPQPSLKHRNPRTQWRAACPATISATSELQPRNRAYAFCPRTRLPLPTSSRGKFPLSKPSVQVHSRIKVPPPQGSVHSPGPKVFTNPNARSARITDHELVLAGEPNESEYDKRCRYPLAQGYFYRSTGLPLRHPALKRQDFDRGSQKFLWQRISHWRKVGNAVETV